MLKLNAATSNMNPMVLLQIFWLCVEFAASMPIPRFGNDTAQFRLSISGNGTASKDDANAAIGKLLGPFDEEQEMVFRRRGRKGPSMPRPTPRQPMWSKKRPVIHGRPPRPPRPPTAKGRATVLQRPPRPPPPKYGKTQTKRGFGMDRWTGRKGGKTAPKPPPRPRPGKKAKPQANKKNWKKSEKGKKYDKSPQRDPKQQDNRRGYGYDEDGKYGNKFYHDDYGGSNGGDYVDDSTGRKRPGIFSYAPNSVPGVSKLVGGKRAVEDANDEYRRGDGGYDLPDPYDPPATYRKRTDKSGGGLNILGMGNIGSWVFAGGLPFSFLCCLVIAGFICVRKRRGGSSDSSGDGTSRKRRRIRLPKILRRKKDKKPSKKR